MPVLETNVTTEVLTGFHDPRIGPGVWGQLLKRGQTNAVNLTWHWQRCWWNAFGRGRLLLIAAWRDDKLTAIAPLFADSGMIFNICPEDHLDFVGDVSDAAVFDAILIAARDCVDDFLGFRFYFIPDRSTTGLHLEQAASRLGLDCLKEESLADPEFDLSRTDALVATRKKSLLRHENYFRRE